MSGTEEQPIAGTVSLQQHNLPGLDAGEYRLAVTQTVSTQAEPLTELAYFSVAVPRYALPEGMVVQLFPPENSTGEYDNSFPHIVLAAETYPWSRMPGDPPPDPRASDGGDERDVATWLAVLLLDEDDAAAYPGLRLEPRATTVRELFRPQSETLEPGFSTLWPRGGNAAPGETAIVGALDWGEHPDDPCTVLDVPLALFRQVAPSAKDLLVSAHVRRTQVTRKATRDGVVPGATELSRTDGAASYAVVSGTRLAATHRQSAAFLVSLEGLAHLLPSDEATSTPGDDPVGFVRLICLRSWRFTSIGDGRRFERLLQNLRPNAGPTGAADFGLHLPIPPDAPPGHARDALAMGFVPMRHHTRDGGETMSWYRGPMIPYRLATRTLPPTLASADAATAYDPQTGLFDVSYAAAWQLGRLLAMRDKHFSVALYGWRRDNARAVVANLEALVVRTRLTEILRQLGGDAPLHAALAAFAPVPSRPDAPLPLAAPLAGGNADRAAGHIAAIADPDTIAAHLDGLGVPAEIYSWLARLKLLHGVPFAYLVPDDSMLPPESIRFFQLDMNWVDAMIDGALSIGRNAAKDEPSPEQAHDAAVRPIIDAATDSHARAQRLGSSAPGTDALETVSGFLLRSEVVRGWPNLEVDGHGGTILLRILRLERLADDVLLCLFEKDGLSLTSLSVHEPAEGLHFGLRDGTTRQIVLRVSRGDHAHPPGTPILRDGQPRTHAVPFRGGGRVVRLFKLACDLRGADPAIQPTTLDHLPASELALQMVKGVGLVRFDAVTAP